jgi:hypothetical protein
MRYRRRERELRAIVDQHASQHLSLDPHYEPIYELGLRVRQQLWLGPTRALKSIAGGSAPEHSIVVARLNVRVLGVLLL